MDVVVSQVRLMFSLDTITDCAVAANWLYLVVSSSSVVRINLDSPGTVENISIPARHAETAGSIHRIFVDRRGAFVLAVTTKLEHFVYSDSARPEFEPVTKLKGTPTVCCAFHPAKKGTFFLGTKLGAILEVAVDAGAHEHYFKRDSKSVVQAWKGAAKEPVHALLLQNSGRALLAAHGHQLLQWQADGADAERLFAGKPRLVYTNPDAEPLRQLAESPDGATLALVLGPARVAFARKGGDFEPLAVADADFVLLSNYHLLALTRHGVESFSLLAKQPVRTTPLPDSKPFAGCSVDLANQTFWAFTDEDLYEIKLEHETAGLWKTLADQGRFDAALEVCDTKEARSRVLELHGYALLPTDAARGARLLGASAAPFETLVLAVMDAGGEAALAALLHARLAHTQSRFQQVLLTSLLAELGEYADLEKHAFDAATVLQAMRRRGDFAALITFATAIGDYAAAAQGYVAAERWPEALALVRQHGAECPELVYAHAAALLRSVPKETVESWMRLPQLDAARLLPSLIAYADAYRGPVAENQALRYLKHLVYKEQNRDEAVFEAVLAILCARADSAELLAFVKEQVPANYDNDFALRLALKHRQYECAVYLYTQMGLYEEAVLLCLKVGGEAMFALSVDIADKQAAGNEELRKHLLRVISKHAIEAHGPAAALQFIHLLRIGDLLVQFPEFESLAELAPEVVRSLEHTKNKLLAINAEIDESLRASEEIQREISEFRKQSVLVEPGEPCQFCSYPLATRRFTVFPCQHGFHADCLQKNMQQISRGRVKEATECALCCDENIRQIVAPLSAEF